MYMYNVKTRTQESHSLIISRGLVLDAINHKFKIICSYTKSNDKWRPPSLSELIPMVFDTGLTHLGSDTSI